jgi:predicted TPR repeat methyltransferase
VYSLACATDVLVYIGDLVPLFAGLPLALKPGALFACSTESLDVDAAAAVPFMLRPTGRFAHKRSYVTSVAADVGIAVVAHRHCEIRKNGGEPIMGDLFVMQLAV